MRTNVPRSTTLVGLPRMYDPAFDNEPFWLVRRKSGVYPRATPREAATIPAVTELRSRMRNRTPPQRHVARGAWKEFALSAALVFMLGAALVGWLL